MPLIQWIIQNLSVAGPNWTGRGGLALSGSATIGIGFSYVGQSGMVLSGEAIVPPIHLDVEGLGGIHIFGKSLVDYVPLYPKIRVKDVSNSERIDYFDNVEKQLTYVLDIIEQIIVGPDPNSGSISVRIKNFQCNCLGQTKKRPPLPEYIADPTGSIWKQFVFLSDGYQAPDIKSPKIITPLADPLPGSILIPIRTSSETLARESSAINENINKIQRIEPIQNYIGGIKRIKICQ